jgi:ankyrin repeat protein
LLGENLHLDMLKLLLSYKPELNYEIPYCKNFTLLQMLAINKKLGNRSYLAKILLENGANVNFHSKQGNGSTSSLVYSYISNNYELFQIFLKYGANLKDLNEKSSI